MKKTVFSSFICLCTLASGLYGTLTIPNNAQKIECQIQPVTVTPQGPNIRKSPGNSDGNSTYPHLPTMYSTSSNWSGYAAATSLKHPKDKSVSSVSGFWTVPTLFPLPNDAYTASWVGIDGYSSQTVEQIGTLQNWISGAQENFAFFEMYPQPAFLIVGFPVNNGDVVGGDVTYLGDHIFELTLYNVTQSVYTIIPTSYTKSKIAKRNSAEWIVEAPSLNNQVLPLANYGTINFTNCQTTIKGHTGSISNRRWKYDAITMAKIKSAPESVPSSLGFGGTSFSTVWYNQ